MLSYQRYQGEADMALSARNAAGTDAEWMAYDQAWEALITAGRHSSQALRWRNEQQADFQAAGTPPGPSVARFLRGTVSDPAARLAQLTARAERARSFADANERAAEECAARAARCLGHARQLTSQSQRTGPQLVMSEQHPPEPPDTPPQPPPPPQPPQDPPPSPEEPPPPVAAAPTFTATITEGVMLTELNPPRNSHRRAK